MDELERRDYPQSERDEMDDSDFGDPENQAFPIKTAQDVINAASRLHNSKGDQEAIKARIKRIAKRKGFPLPQTWQDEDNKERSMEATTDTLTRAANHEPYTGTHSHAHPAHDSQGDDSTHTHSHAHDNDNNHDHSHSSEERAIESFPGLQMYLPITRTDKDAWVIEGQATSEALDSYGTIFEYESSKKAFQKWMERGNIREQHDPRKAVGKALAVEFDDENKAIFVRARISKGARDTWEKILDGTLSGFSVGMSADAKVRHIDRAGKQVPMYYDTTLAELSVVDAPGSPRCDIAIARADGIITDVIDNADEEEAPATPVEATPTPDTLDRAGARLSADSRTALHNMRDQAMSLCGCDECAGMSGSGKDDGDGDTSRAIEGLIERILEQKLTPVYSRLQGIAGTLARSNAAPTPLPIESIVTSAITRAVEAAQSANESSLSEVRAELSAVKGTVDKIAETPVPGAPIMNAGALPRPVEKRLATDPYQSPARSGSSVYDAIAQLSAQGQLDTIDKQVDALHAGLVAQQRRG